MNMLNAIDARSLFMDNNKLGLWVMIIVCLFIIILVVSLIVLIVNRNKPIKVDCHDEVYGQAISEFIPDNTSHVISERSENTIKTIPTRQISSSSKTVIKTVPKSTAGSPGRLL